MVPHVHLHVIPRPQLNRIAEKMGAICAAGGDEGPWTMFRRGHGHMDEEKAMVLVGEVRG